MKIISSALLFLCFSCVNANMGPVGFSPFPNHYFVETGTLGGEAIAMVLRTGLFSEIYSMDIDASFVSQASRRFSDYKNVHVFQGDTGKDLGQIIRKIDKPATFWLDAHTGSTDSLGGKNCPVLEELEQIKHHPIKTHTILIDDMHCCGTAFFDFITQDQIIQKILEINSDYTIDYINGGNEGEYPNNIMVARVLGK